MATKFDGLIKRSEYLCVDPAIIVVAPDFNPRFDQGDLAEIENSIKVRGFFKNKPLVVQRTDDGKLMLRGRGGRRFTAVQNLLKKGHVFEDGIPVVVEGKDVTDAEALILDLIDNNQKPLLPLEEAAAYKRLLDGGIKVKEIAKLVHRSEANVKWTLCLLDADESVKDAMKDGTINSSLGKDIAQKAGKDKAKQKELVEKATKGGKAGKKLVKEEVASIKRRPTTKKKQEALVAKVLTESQLRTRESVLIKHVTEGLSAIGITEDQARKHFSEYDIGAAAFHFGVLIGLRAALGLDPKITL